MWLSADHGSELPRGDTVGLKRDSGTDTQSMCLFADKENELSGDGSYRVHANYAFPS